MLASLCKSDDFVDDDLRYRVVNITLEQERVADLVKCAPHGLHVPRLNVVLRKWHRASPYDTKLPTAELGRGLSLSSPDVKLLGPESIPRMRRRSGPRAVVE